MGLPDCISWFQSELVYYDAWLWDKSIEQRILRELGTKSDKVHAYNKDRVDLDVLKGSAYKNKTKHDWTTEIWRGIKTTAFASIHRDYWSRHTSPRVANYIMFHFALQILQVVCYLLLDPRTTKVTTSDILVPMALGLGLGILHAQITAYDPQRLKRKRSPSSGKSFTDLEPPQSLTPVPLPLLQVNSSNLSEALSRSEAVLTESPVKEISSSSNNISRERDSLPSCQQLLEAGENESPVKESLVLEESKDPESEISETFNPPNCTRRSLSLKLAPSKRDIIINRMGQSDQSQVPAPTQPKPSTVDNSANEADNVEVNHYSRKRSASLSPDFCLSLPVVPLEAKIKHFKEAKLRGVTDPEVLADLQQQLSPKILKNLSKWEEGVEGGDEESGSEEPEITENAFHPNETNSNANGDRANLQISTPAIKGASVVEDENVSSQPQELDLVKGKETEQLEEEEEGDEEPDADVDDNDYEDDDLDLSDTLTAHRRQRANFYKIFVQRAGYHRHQLQKSYCSRLPDDAQTSIESNTTPESICTGSSLTGSKNLPTSNSALVPACRRGSNAAQKRGQVSRTKVVNFIKKKPSMESMGHPASETEYERMNSDVRSDESSSGSDDEQAALRERASVLRTEASTSDSPTIVTTSTSQVKHQPQQLQLKQLSVRTVGMEDVPPSGVGGSVGDFEVIPSPIEEHTDVGSTGVAECDAPFVLWYFYAIQGMSDPSYAQSESVSCYVWEGKSMRKSSFTLLDIGWRIIQAVERQKVSKLYPKVSVIIVTFLAVLPLFFHIWNQPASLRPLNASVLIGPLPKAELLTVGSNPFQTPGTLVLYLYHKIADFMTHIWFPTRRSIQNDLFWLATLDNLVIGLGIFLRFNIYAVIFFLLCVAERSFQQRHFYAKHFYALTSSHRARRCCIPHLRLNKVAHVKCWLTLRSYLKKRGPQRSVECIVTATFYLAFVFGLGFCYQYLSYGSRQHEGVFSSPLAWDILAYTAGLGIFLLRFLTLGLKIAKKFRNISVLLSEQLNLHLCLNRKPQKKDELTTTNQVLKMAESLLKEVDGPYRICGWAVNPLIYNVFKLVLLSSFSAFISEILGFKLKLYKLKLNPANW